MAYFDELKLNPEKQICISDKEQSNSDDSFISSSSGNAAILQPKDQVQETIRTGPVVAPSKATKTHESSDLNAIKE